MEEKKTINSSIGDRVTVSADNFLIKKGVPGEHSMTGREFETTVKLRKYKMFSLIDGIQLVNRNDGAAKYYLVEDGTVFKYVENSFSFYKLNLEEFVWESKQSLASIYFDTYLKFQELPDFEDYYPNREELDLDKGMNL